MENTKTLLGYEGLFIVDRVRRRGGLVMLWEERDIASLISFSQHHIDISTRVEGKGQWHLMSFYGFTDRRQRRES